MMRVKKSEVGLGIKRIEDIAKAIVVKLSWKFIQGDSPQEKWMHNKYCNKSNFWAAFMDNNASNT